ncbi:uncharacterized protein LOC117005459 [Catharus ustulatus]|uniref:uncharacterized protein LOC117005459 n=1 Tax=Catharus ustulatus TaxID=91951 RepID=UPI00140AAEE9|nr:uncharacterized protein LOC117005459 [Catharus ustulatus]
MAAARLVRNPVLLLCPACWLSFWCLTVLRFRMPSRLWSRRSILARQRRGRSALPQGRARGGRGADAVPAPRCRRSPGVRVRRRRAPVPARSHPRPPTGRRTRPAVFQVAPVAPLDHWVLACVAAAISSCCDHLETCSSREPQGSCRASGSGASVMFMWAAGRAEGTPHPLSVISSPWCRLAPGDRLGSRDRPGDRRVADQRGP